MKMPVPSLWSKGVVALGMAGVLALGGCASEGGAITEVDVPGGAIDVDGSRVNVALVVGSNVRGNMECTTEFPAQVEGALVASLQTGGDAAVVSVEGKPSLYPLGNMQSSAASFDIRMEENDATVQGLLASICQGGLPATSPEADCSAAITLGGRMLSGVDSDDSVEIMLVADSLLASAGQVSFGEGGIPIGGIGPAEAVNRLVEASMVPDLGCVERVCVFYLGDSASPQESPSEAERGWLREFWSAYFEAAGTTATFSQTPPAGSGGDAAEGLPEVSIIPFDHEMEGAALWGDLAGGEVIELSSDGGGAFAFEPDSPDLIDEGAAREAAAGLAEEVTALPEGSVVEVAGHTAGNGDGAELSQARAERVLDLLVSAGADRGRLVARGYGCGDSPSHTHIADVVDGKLVEDQATKNRLVTLSLAQES